MIKRIKALIIKEFLAILQDKKSRTVLIIPPLVQLFIFSFAATLDVENVNIGVWNKDNGKYSYELIQRFVGSSTFKNIYFYHNEKQVERAIDNEEALIVVHIRRELFPRYFGEKRCQGSVFARREKIQFRADCRRVCRQHFRTVPERYKGGNRAAESEDNIDSLELVQSQFALHLVYCSRLSWHSDYAHLPFGHRYVCGPGKRGGNIRAASCFAPPSFGNTSGQGHSRDGYRNC